MSFWRKWFGWKPGKSPKTIVRNPKRPLRFELLEDRITPSTLLGVDDQPDVHADDVRIVPFESAASLPSGPRPSQLFYLDLDAATDVDFNGPVVFRHLDVPAYRAPERFAGQEAAIVDALLSALHGIHSSFDVTFTTARPSGAVPYSTIYVGGTDAAFQDYGRYLGLSEHNDVGNQNPRDNAFVFSELFDVAADSARAYGESLASLVAHEAGRLLGVGDTATPSNDPLAAVGWKVYTHVETARDIRRDVVDDGRVNILGRDYKVNPKLVAAIRDYPSFYYAGTCGPDTFPDIVYGQSLIHPVDSGTWLTRVLDMAWAAQSDNSFSAAEKSQILAFAYGFATHAAGDVWAHTVVNELTEGVFPSFFELPKDVRKLANAVRHFLVEGYIDDALAGSENNPDRDVLPDGDISDDATQGNRYDAPIRFIFDTFIKPFAGDPTVTVEAPKGSRGLILNQVFALRAKLETQATQLGPKPEQSFNALALGILADQLAGNDVKPDRLDEAARAYLYQWIDNIDDGLRHWGEAGLALARGFFGPQDARDLQNLQGKRFGSEFDGDRIDAEGGVNFVDRVIHELEDPNGDGFTDDSFVTNHLLPMLGVPKEFAQVRSVLDGIATFVDNQLVGPLQLALNPIRDILDGVKEVVVELIEDFVENKFGIDLDVFEFLTDLGSKMDVRSVTVKDKVVPVFKPDSHALLDSFMGSAGSAQSEPLDEFTQNLPGIEFYREGEETNPPRGSLDDNVEFDKNKFAAYKNTLTLGKLVLLQELPTDADFAGGELSRLFTDLTGRPYDFGKLNLNGSHGGNIMTATLPKPGTVVEVSSESGEPGEERSDARPWLVSIDTDHEWRENSQTRFTSQYRSIAPGAGANSVTWTFTNLPAGDYDLQASWLANVTFTPATNATYTVLDGAQNPSVVVNQQGFSDEVTFKVPLPEISPQSTVDINFDSIKTFHFGGGTLRIKLIDAANGEVLAGPMRLVSADGAVDRIARIVRRADGTVDPTTPGYVEVGAWEDLKYRTGTGNFPLWESGLLRPTFRMLFTDWQNGDQNFPDLGDMPSPDPNERTIFPDGSLGNLAGSFDPLPVVQAPIGIDLTITGAQTLAFDSDVVLHSVHGNADATLDSMTLNVTGQVRLVGVIGGGGLSIITINATKGIVLDDGALIYSRQIAAGADPHTASSIGTSGNITLSAGNGAISGPRIILGVGAGILAHATNGFQAGDVAMTVTDSPNALNFDIHVAGFAGRIGRATIDIGTDAALTGRDVHLSATTAIHKTATLSSDLPATTDTELAQQISDDSLATVSFRAAASVSDAAAHLLLHAGASILASGNVLLESTAISSSLITTSGKFLGITFGSSEANAELVVENGAKITAAGNVDAMATTNNLLDVLTIVPAGGDVANISFSYGKARSNATTDIQAGSSITATNVTINAENDNNFRNRAIALGFPGGNVGVGATAVLGAYQTEAKAVLAGRVTTTGNLTVQADSDDAHNEARAFAAVTNPLGQSDLLDAVKGFLGGIDLSQVVGDQTINPTGAGPGLVVSGALVLAESENKAAALIDDAAFVKVGGNLIVHGVAEENFQTSATSTAGPATQAGVGGAVAFNNVANQATAFLGFNAVVDVAHALNVSAEARMPDQVSAFDPSVDLSQVGNNVGQVADELQDAKDAGAALKNGLTPLAAHLNSLLADPAKIGTSYIHAGGTVAQGGAVGVAGGVNVLKVHNLGVAALASGAQVNQREAGAVDQDVRVSALGAVGVTDLAGQDSPLTYHGPGRTNGAAGIGGFFNGVFIDNRANGYIDDLADVKAVRDVIVTATTQSSVLAATQAGTTGSDVAVDGSVNIVRVNNESLATIEDRARVTSGRDVTVDADSSTRIINVAGGAAQGRTGGVGASAAITIVNDDTKAMIANPEKGMGDIGTGGELGSVHAGRNIALDADTAHEIYTVSVAGSASALQGTGGTDEFEGMRFGFGVSGDVAINQVHEDTEAFIRDVPDVVAGQSVTVSAASNDFQAATAGATVVGNDAGIGGSFAQNQQERTTRAFLEHAAISVGDDVSVDANNAGTVLTFADGGSSTSSGVSVAGSVTQNKLTNSAAAFTSFSVNVHAVDNVTLNANSATDLISAAGASTTTQNGFLAVGATLDLGTLDSQARAYFAERSLVQSDGNVSALANNDDDVLSVSAARAQATGAGQATRLYRNNGTSAPFGGVAGVDATGKTDLTTAIALADLDGDTDLDLVTGNFAQFNKRFLNNGAGTFDVGQNIGVDPIVFAKNKIAPTSDQLVNMVTPDFTTSLTVGDVDGDGDQDIIAGNLGQPNRVYFNDGTGNFFAGKNIGTITLNVPVNPNTTLNNNGVEDLIADLQAAVDAALIAQGLQAGRVQVKQDALGLIFFTGQGLFGKPQAILAGQAVASARRDGVIATPGNAPLTFGFDYDGRSIAVALLPGDTLDNGTARGLVSDVQGAINRRLTDLQAGTPGDVVARLDGERIVFGLAAHTLSGVSAASSVLEALRSGFRLLAPAGGGLINFTLTYDGKTISAQINPTATNDNTTLAHLLADVQRAFDQALAAAGAGRAGDIASGVDGQGRLTFTLKTHTLGDVTDAENRLNDARRSGWLDPTGPLSFQLLLTDADATSAVALGDVDGDGDLDLIAGNLDAPNRLYLNDGAGDFGIGRALTAAPTTTSALVLADLDGDHDLDLVTGNVGYDLTQLVDRGVLRVENLLTSTEVAIEDLVASGLVSLADLIEKGLLNKLDFNALTNISIGDLIQNNLATLENLVRTGVVLLGQFTNIELPSADLIQQGLVTALELAQAGFEKATVALADLVNSGLVYLSELVNVDFVGLDDLKDGDVNLGNLLAASVTTLKELVAKELVNVTTLLRERLDLKALVNSGLVKLRDLVQKNLLTQANLDLGSLDFTKVRDALSAGNPMQIFLNDSHGNFDAGHDVSGDRFITRTLAVGDIDGDGDADLIAGNSGSRNRLYRNLGGGRFDLGSNIQNDKALTQAVALGDVDKDGDLDLVVGNLGAPNRLYLNTQGSFGPGVNLTNDVNATTSLALQDIDRDGDLDVLAGTAKPMVGVAGSAAALGLTQTVEAFVDDVVTINSGRNVVIDANNQTTLSVLVGAAANANTASIGLSFGHADLERNVRASIGDASVTAAGVVATEPGRQGVTVEATSAEDLLFFGAGAAAARDAGVAASALFNTIGGTTEAIISSGAEVTAVNLLAGAAPSVEVHAAHQRVLETIAGSSADTNRFGIGAAADIENIQSTVRASIGDGARVSASANVVVNAESTDDIDSSVGALAFGQTLTVAGSLAFVTLDTTTQAFVGAAAIEADGNVGVFTDSLAHIDLHTGAGTFQSVLGIGVSAGIVLKTDLTEASVAADATIVARGLRGTMNVQAGVDSGATELVKATRGLAVTATSDENLTLTAVGGQAGNALGGVGSFTVALLNETTRATLEAGVIVNQAAAGSSHQDQSVYVLADDDTRLIDVAGASVSNSLLGIGAGVDFVALVKDTEASLAGDIDANLNVEVVALSQQDVASITSSSNTVIAIAFAAAGSVLGLNVITRAVIADHARVRSRGNVRVSADDQTEIDLRAGMGATGAFATGGGSVTAAVVEKTVEALIGPSADVVALGTRSALTVPSGDFTITNVAQANATGEVAAPFNSVAAKINDLVNSEVLSKIQDFLADAFTLATSVTIPGIDPSLSQQRVATPLTRTVQGLAVTALSRDDIETMAVGFAASGAVSPELSGSAVVTTNRTTAAIDSGALINQGADANGVVGSVQVAAGSDEYHMGIAGAAPVAGLAAIGASGSLTMMDNITEAFVGAGAQVRAAKDVEVQARAREDVLSIAATAGAAVAAGGTTSLPVVSLNSRTHAFLAENTIVNAGGNVVVVARDDTDADVLAGAAGAGLVAGAGVSAGMTLIDKDTQAFVGHHAQVEAGGTSAPSVNVLGGDVSGSAFTTENIHGLAVQARSSEVTFGFAAGGGVGLAGIAGAIQLTLLDSDTAAFIDHDARVNQAGGATIQTVNVSAANDARIFGGANNLAGGLGVLAGGVDVGLVRNDTDAFIAAGADVRARQDIEVHALARKEVDSLVSGFGATAGIGVVASYSIYAINSSIDNDLFGVNPLSLLNSSSTADTVQDYLDRAVLSFTATAGAGLGKVVSAYGGFSKGIGEIREALVAQVPVSAASTAIEATGVGTGNRARVTGATLNAGRHVEVSSKEVIDGALCTSFTFNFDIGSATLINVYQDRGILVTGGTAVTAVEGGANIQAGGNVTILSDTANVQTVASTTSVDEVRNTSRASVAGSTINAVGLVTVDAGNDTEATFSSLLPTMGSGVSKSTQVKVRNTIDAHINQNAVVTGGTGVDVTALDDGNVRLAADAITLKAEGTFGFLPVQGKATATADIADTVTAFVDAATITATTGDIDVTATSKPTIKTLALGGTEANTPAIGASLVNNHLANDIDAKLSGATIHATVGSVNVVALDDATIAGRAGGAAFSTGTAGLGAAAAINVISDDIHALVDGAQVQAGNDVIIQASATPEIKALAAGGAGADAYSGAGSIAFNTIGNTVEARALNGAAITAADQARLLATDSSDIDALAGAGSGAATASVSASIATNTISNVLRAAIDNADATAASVDLIASAAADILAITGTGSGAGDPALTGSSSLNNIDNVIDAHILAANADVFASGTLNVLGLEDSVIKAIAGAAAGAGSIAIAGTLAENQIGTDVTAKVGSGAEVHGATANISASDNAGIRVVSGAASGAGTAALGAATSLNTLTNTARALLDGASLTATTANVTANANGKIEAISAIGTGAGTGAANIALAKNDAGSVVEARVLNNANITASGVVTVAASDGALIRTLSGSASGAGTAAIAPAVSLNLIHNQTRAVVDNGDITGATVNVTAGEATGTLASTGGTPTPTARLEALAIGGSGAGAAALAGSDAKNTITNVVEALVQTGSSVNTTATAANTGLIISASDSASIRSLAGGAAGAGAAAAGAAVAINSITNTIRGGIASSLVDSATDVRINATTTNNIHVIAASGAGAGGFAGQASVAKNIITSTVESRIIGTTANVTADDLLKLTASDTSTIHSLAGTAGGAGGANVGAAFGLNEIGSTIKARIENGAIAAEDIGLDVDLAATIDTLATGVSGAGGGTVTGGVSLNNLHATLDAHILNTSNVTALDAIDITADDVSTIHSLAGQAAGAGSTSIGGAGANNRIANIVKAFIDNATVISTTGSVNLRATSAVTIQTIAVGGSVAGLGGVAGSTAVNQLTITTEAYVDDATLTADDNVTLLANSTNNITAYAGSLAAGGVVGISGSSVVNTVENTTHAYVEDSTVAAKGNGVGASVKSFNRDTGTESTEVIKGLSIVATTDENVEVRAVTASMSGTFGISGNVTANLVGDTTEAYIRGANVNSTADVGEAVVVRAHQDTDVGVIGGAAALGFGGAAIAAIDTTFVRNVTKAFIDDKLIGSASTPSVLHANNVEVNSTAREFVEGTIAGAAVSNFSVGGAVSVVELDSVSEGTVKRSDIFSEGNLQIFGDNTARIDRDVGIAAAGLFSGDGGSIAVNNITNATRAQALGANLNAKGQLVLEADTDEDIITRVGTAGVGLGLGLAGAVSVNTIETTTEALTASDAGLPTKLNKAAGFQLAGTAAANQDVRLEADNDVLISGLGGSLGAGAAGIGATVDVGAVRNRVVAQVGADSEVYAGDDVGILALEDREVNSKTFAGGVGLFAVSGAISLAALGGGVHADVNDLELTALRDQVNNNHLHIKTPALNGGDTPFTNTAKNKIANLTDPTITDALNSSVNVTDRVIFAGLEDATSATLGAAITAGGDITISASTKNDVNVKAGQVAVGVAGIGAAVALGTIDSVTKAQAGNFSNLSAGGAVSITASDKQEQDPINQVSGDAVSTINAFGGGIGVVSVGGAVAKMDVDLNVDAHLGTNATVANGASLTIKADEAANVDSHGSGLQVGAVAAGAAITKAEIGGNVKAYIDNSATVGATAGSVGAVSVLTNANNIVEAGSDPGDKGVQGGASVGLLASTVNRAEAFVQSLTIQSFVDDSAVIGATDDITIDTDSVGDANATANGVVIGGGARGLSQADARLNPTVKAFLNDATLTAGDAVTIEAVHTGSEVNAAASASGGGALAVNGADADARASAVVDTFTKDNSQIDAAGAVTIRAQTTNLANAVGDGLTIGVVGKGSVDASSTASGSTKARLEGDVNAGSLLLIATAINVADATTEASGGGLVSGNGAHSAATVLPDVLAYIGDNPDITGVTTSRVAVTGDATVQAHSTTDADTEATGASLGGVTTGNSNASVNVAPTVEVILGQNSDLTAGGNVTIKADHALQGAGPDAEAKGSTVGLIAGASGSFATISSTPTVKAHVGQNAQLTADGSVTVWAESDADGDADVDNQASGFIGIGVGTAQVDIINTVIASLDVSADVFAGDDFLLKARSENEGDAGAEGSGGGAIEIATARSKVNLNHKTTALVDTSAHVTAGDLLTVQALSNNDADVSAEVDGAGLGVGASANDDRGSSILRGAFIGASGNLAVTKAEIGVAANLTGRDTKIEARTEKVRGEATTDVNGKGAGTDSDGGARVEVYEEARVRLLSSAKIRGTDHMLIQAKHDDIDTNADADIRSSGAVGDTDAFTVNRLRTEAVVDADPNAVLTSHDLEVKANSTLNEFRADTNKDGSFFDFGSEKVTKELVVQRRVFFDADVVVLSGPGPTVEIAPNGTVTATGGASVSQTTTRVTVNNIVNDDPGSVEIQVGNQSAFGNVHQSVITGTQSTFFVQETYDKVSIVNHSTKELAVNAIDVSNNSTIQPVVTLNAQNVDGIGSLPLFTFLVEHKVVPTIINIENTASAASADVILNGLIDNPIGTTTISAAGGDILSAGSAAILRTGKATLNAPGGTIGSSTTRINVELVKSANRSIDLDAVSGDDIYLNLKGRLRETGVSNFAVTGGNLNAADDIDILLQDAVSETTASVPAYTVDVFLPQDSPQHVNVSRIFRPSSNPPATPPPDLGVFGATPTTIAASYNFNLLHAADIDVTKSGAGVAGVTANTDLTGTGRINVNTNGDVSVSETAGDLRIGAVTSSSSTGTLTLTAQGSIVDALNDAAADVSGVNVTLNAATGGIGSAADAFEVDSSNPGTGTVNATTVLDIFLTETNGTLNVGAITSSDNVTLIATNGSIVESGSDTAADINADNLTLKALSSGIGASSNDLEIDTARTAAGSLTVDAAQGIFLAETAGSLTLPHAVSTSGEIRLSTIDAAAAGQNLIVATNGLVDAATTVTLQAGDNLDTNTGSLVDGTSVIFRGDNNSADAGVGATITLRGDVSGTTAQVLGGPDDDTLVFIGWNDSATVNGNAGNDTLNLNLNGGTVTTQELMTLTSTVVTNAAASSATISGSLTLASAGVTFNVADGAAASDLVVNATIAGSTALTKGGAGTMVLAGVDTYTGATNVNAGTLLVNGSQSASAVNVQGGTLGGIGTVGATTVNSGTLNPAGTGVGRLNIIGNLTMTPQATLFVNINGTTLGTLFDNLNVQGAINLGGATLAGSVGFTSTVGNKYVIASNDAADAVTGSFGNVVNNEITIGGIKFSVNKAGGDGNDVELTHINTNSAFANRSVTSPIPENGIAVLTGTPIDADAKDRFMLMVNWGDGSKAESFKFAPGTPSVRLTHRYLDSGTFTIGLQWLDQHGGGRGDQLTVVVENVTPTVRITGPTQGKVDHKQTMTFLASDASPIDAKAAFTYFVDWGDGVVETLTGKSSLRAGHVYRTAGTFTIRVVALDKDGGFSQEATLTQTIKSKLFAIR